MSGRVLVVKNIEREGPGILREVLQQNDIEADVVELDRGDSIPSLEPYSALIILGGPPSANDNTTEVAAELEAAKLAIRSGLPYLGICLGHQILAKAAGGEVVVSPVKEVGFIHTNGAPYVVTLTEAGRKDQLFDGINDKFPVFQLHGEAVVPNDDIEVLATGAYCPVQVIRVGRRAYGMQMHVEVTPEMATLWCEQDPMLEGIEVEISGEYLKIGQKILTNFLLLAGLVQPIDLSEFSSVSN